jgi:leucyl aminopeptidase (aminopeptidase T)
MWGFEEEMMVVGGANVDHAEMESLSLKLTERLTRAKRGRMTTPEGSDISFSLDGREGFALLQTAHKSGEHCACPGGEATICPVRGSASGVLVSPFCIEHKDLGQITAPMRIEVKAGLAVSASGSPEGERFWAILDEAGELAKNVAEFAFGTNGACRKRVTVREAKKAMGTCHMAFGDSQSLAGEVNTPLHVDMIYDRPTVWLDDEMVMKDGNILI